MKVQLFYHCAVMGSWRRVVREQMDLFRSVGLRPKIGVVGPMRPRLRQMIDGSGDLLYHHPDVRQYETPTLQDLWEWCRSLDDPSDTSVIYCHTKGVSRPEARRRAWRKLMEHWVVSRWRENLPLMEDHDAAGVCWRLSARRWPTPHFSGTFWMARADWITQLDSPIVHRDRGDPRWQAVNRRADWTRMHAEMWIGSKPGIRVQSLACSDTKIHRMDALLPLLKACGHPEYT